MKEGGVTQPLQSPGHSLVGSLPRLIHQWTGVGKGTAERRQSGGAAPEREGQAQRMAPKAMPVRPAQHTQHVFHDPLEGAQAIQLDKQASLSQSTLCQLDTQKHFFKA